ncbi:MAG: hypothetical protein FD123_116 [Bacteroidetes bacterium]|nr:MAG: hypothetical protein FD123_116 [Bacteroidota bacterium]
MIDENLVIELTNHSDMEQSGAFDDQEFILRAGDHKTQTLSVSVLPGDKIDFSICFVDISEHLRLRFEILPTSEFMTVIRELNGWECYSEDGHFHFEYAGMLHHTFTVPTIGIVIVGTTDPAIPPGSN